MLRSYISFESNWQYVPQEDDYFGEYKGLPLVLHTLSYEPSLVMFRFRTRTVQEPRTIELPYGHTLEVEKNYTFLRIAEPEQLGVKGIKELLEQVLQNLTTAGLVGENECSVCGQNDETELVYDNGSIGKICKKCLTEKATKQQIKQEVLHSRAWPLKPVVALAGFYVAFAWALAWFAYDWVFTHILGGAEEVMVPQLFIGLVMAVFGFVIVLPVMFGLSQTRLVRMTEGHYYTGWLIFAGICLGEWFYLVTTYKTFNPFLLLQVMFSQHLMYIGTKIAMLVISLLFLNFFSYKNRKPSLGIDSKENVTSDSIG